jgi:hypothetical protein
MPTRTTARTPARLARLAPVAVLAALALWPSPASAHGFSTTVYADVTQPERGHVRVELGLEYDLLVVSVADTQHVDALYQEGQAAFDDGDTAAMARALADHPDPVLAYVTERFGVASGDDACTPTQDGDVTMTQREGVPYAVLVLDEACAPSDGSHTITSTLFPDAEGYVKDAKTVVSYDLDEQHGSAALDPSHPAFSTDQSFLAETWTFFRLGAEHLLTGTDHILFLLAVIVGSRRLREIVLAATAFTVAHSITFVCAATGLVDVPARVVEPVIALSIAVVAGWHLWRLRSPVQRYAGLELARGPLGLDRAGWLRLGVVLCFGLVHGLGFAGALGLDRELSGSLLWSLLVFNVGIEAVQLGIILVVFPLLALLRRRSPRVGAWVTGAVAAGVAVMGLLWFVERVTTG